MVSTSFSGSGPTTRIPEIWITSDGWRVNLGLHLNEILLADSEKRSIMRRIALYADDEKTRSWASGCLLSIAQWLTNDEATDLLRWGIDAWARSPPSRCADTLSGIAYLLSVYPESRQGGIEMVSESLIRRSYTLSVDHDLQSWRLLMHWNDLAQFQIQWKLYASSSIYLGLGGHLRLLRDYTH